MNPKKNLMRGKAAISSMKKGIALIALAALLLSGCAEPSGPILLDYGRPVEIRYELGVEFNAKEAYGNPGYLYTGAGAPDLRVVSFTDSRCKEGTVCIWAGELGVNLLTTYFEKTDDPTKLIGPLIKEFYLGERTNRKEIVYGKFEIELVSIDFGKKEAVLKVTEVQEPPPLPEEKQWFSFEPKQCGTNEWEVYIGEIARNTPPNAGAPLPSSEEEKVKFWLLGKHNIEIQGFASKKVYDIVCLACSCPRGDVIAVLVDSRNAEKMLGIGWKEIGNTACTEEEKLCPDGSGVGRQAPFCEFAECPVQEGIEITKTDVPGLMINPQTVITKIMGNGSVQIETIDYNVESGEQQKSVVTGTVPVQRVREIAALAVQTNFFGLTEEDTRSCIIDLPTKTLEVKIGEKVNAVNEIGAECEPGKLGGTRQIIGRIEETIENDFVPTVSIGV